MAIDEASFIELKNQAELLYFPNDTIEISWDNDSLLPQSLVEEQDVNVTVNIQLAEIDTETGGTKIITTLASDVANTGQYSAVIPSDYNYNGISAAVIQITIANVQSSNPSLSTRFRRFSPSKIFIGAAVVSSPLFYLGYHHIYKHQDRCEEWYRSERDSIGDEINKRLPPCPPNVNKMTGNNNFEIEDLGDTFREFFHPNTSSCYRQISFTP